MWVVAVAAIVVFVGLVIATAGHARAARQHAAGAADMSALAAARARQAGTQRPCTVASEIARANAARLADCTVQGPNVDVTVTVAAGSVMSVPLRATGHARAGPATNTESTNAPAQAHANPTKTQLPIP